MKRAFFQTPLNLQIRRVRLTDQNALNEILLSKHLSYSQPENNSSLRGFVSRRSLTFL